jgi:HAD superfamily hydrolase (TIGR01509 family)
VKVSWVEGVPRVVPGKDPLQSRPVCILPRVPVAAVVFDLDNVLIDSEELWAEAREGITREHGGRWRDTAQQEMMGMSSPEWSRWLHDELGVELQPEVISRAVVERLESVYRDHLRLMRGAREAVERMADRWPLGVASSANRPLIELALELSGLGKWFRAVVSSEEVARGKPAPDVYLEAAQQLGVDASDAAAVEDATNGLLSAHAAGMRVIAVPDPRYPPEARALEVAGLVLSSLEELTPEKVEALG